MTDEQLVETARNGEENAFQALMDRYIDAIYGFALQYARNEADAEDIAQDSFFKAWKNLKRFKHGLRFKPWIYAIARNTALDHLKKKKSTVFSELDDEEHNLIFEETLEDSEPLPPAIFEHAELAQVLEKVLDVLHPDHRLVLIMRYRDEMTFEEIAVAMDKPMNTVKSWHHRALQRIRPGLADRLSGTSGSSKPRGEPHQKKPE